MQQKTHKPISMKKSLLFLTFFLPFAMNVTLQAADNLIETAIPSSWTTKPAPTAQGWYTVTSGAISSYPGNSRFENSPSSYTLAKDGATLNANFLFIRWDGFSGYYVFPVELEANTSYTFAMDCAYWNNNGNTGGTVTVNINDGKLMNGNTIATKGFGTNAKQVAYNGSLKFITTNAGTYYIGFTSAGALYAIANLSLTKDEVQVATIYEGDQTYADKGTIFASGFKDGKVTVSGKTDLHIIADLDATPLDSATVNLVGNNAWLFFDYIKPTKTIANLLKYVTVDGNQAVNNTNVRVAIYANGAVVIPYGNTDKSACLTVYDGANFTGNSKTFIINTYYKELGEFDNKVRSFVLRRGFQAVLANNKDGTGMSRCWIANDADLEVAEMPEGMEDFVSFVRCVKFEWVSKKGWSGGVDAENMQNVTCFYDWGCGGTTTNPDFEYAPIHQKAGWPSWDALYSVNNVTVMLNYNEPDDAGQANLTADYAISTWQYMFKSGLRLASPASKDPIGSGWSRRFFATLDSLNYRCDIVAAHLYRQSMAGVNMRNSVNATSTDAKGRPMWITEFNNGANWTNEGWPDATGPQRDADLNIIYDASGNTTTINRPLSPNNSEKQRAWIEDILNALNETDKCERYFIYNWVQDARAMILGGKLTPAGKAYASFKAAEAFSSKSEFVHNWKIAPPFVTSEISSDYRSVNLSWYDHNGETGKKYIVECKKDNDAFQVVKEVLFGTDYQAGATVSVTVPLECDARAVYRVKAVSYKDTQSINSRHFIVTRDESILAPELVADSITALCIRLTWNKVESATSYKLERSSQPTTGFTTLSSAISDTCFTVSYLDANTTYYFRLTNNLRGSSYHPISEVLEVTTRELVAPETPENIAAIVSADNIRLTWDASVDARYRIYRTTNPEGEYEMVKDKTFLLYYKDTDIQENTTYYYCVQAFNDAGESEWSEPYAVNTSLSGISGPVADEEPAVIYNLYGVRQEVISKPGIYIVNGKKVFLGNR